MFVDQSEPSQFKLLGILLFAFKDPDWDFPFHSPNSAALGVRLGHNTKLPRAPAVFEKKEKWRRYEEDLLSGDSVWSKNNVSAADNLKAAEKQFEEACEPLRRQPLEQIV